jgi:hypothetical protein
MTPKMREHQNADGDVDYNPGWRCLTDGQRTTLRANANLRKLYPSLLRDDCWSLIGAQEFLDMLADYVAVSSSVDFVNALGENVKFKLEDPALVFTIERFSKWMEGFAQYTLRFREVKAFLGDAHAEIGGTVADYYMPPLTYEEGGLLKAFLDPLLTVLEN